MPRETLFETFMCDLCALCMHFLPAFEVIKRGFHSLRETLSDGEAWQLGCFNQVVGH